MFCNVEAKNVIAFRDVKNTIYECPLDLSQDKIDRIVTRRLGLDVPAPNLADWQRYVGRVISPSHSIRIAVNTSLSRTPTNPSMNPSLTPVRKMTPAWKFSG